MFEKTCILSPFSFFYLFHFKLHIFFQMYFLFENVIHTYNVFWVNPHFTPHFLLLPNPNSAIFTPTHCSLYVFHSLPLQPSIVDSSSVSFDISCVHSGMWNVLILCRLTQWLWVHSYHKSHISRKRYLHHSFLPSDSYKLPIPSPLRQAGGNLIYLGLKMPGSLGFWTLTSMGYRKGNS